MKKVIAVLLSAALLFSVCGISFSASALAFPKVTDKINQSKSCFTNAPDDGLIYADILYDIVPMTEDEKDDYVYEQCGIRSSDLAYDKSMTDEEKEIRKQKTILYYTEMGKLEKELADTNAEPFLEQMDITIQHSGGTPIYRNRQIVKSDTGMFICLTKKEILKAEQLDYVEGIICYRRVYNDNKITILFENTRNWEKVYAYGWDNCGNETTGTYPGTQVTEKLTDEDGDEYYVVDIPKNSICVLLNDGKDELSNELDCEVFLYEGFYAYRLTGAQTDLNQYIIEGFDKNKPEPSTEPTTEPVPVDRDSFILTDNFGWGEAYVYALDAEGNELCGEFPGNQKTESEITVFGEALFTVNIPEGAVSVTVGNGKGERTAEITDFAYYSNYFMTGETDSSGNYKVIGFNEEPEAPKSFVLLDNYGWKQAYIYALDKDGNELNGAFPGVQAERFLDYGGFQFSIPVPDGAESIVVSSGKGDKTEKITDFSTYYGYSLGTKNTDGDYKLNEFWGYLPAPVSGDIEDPWYEPDTELLITDNFGWGTGYMYAWDDKGNALSGEWPGTITETITNGYGENEFVCDIPNNAAGIIIHDNNGHQSTDITDFTYDGYWFDGTTDEFGHYVATGYVNPTTEPTQPATIDFQPPTVPADYPIQKTVRITDTLGWKTGYMYSWDAEGNALTGEWPGTIVETTTNDYGENVFVCDIPENAVEIIINNGKGQQSTEITDFSNYDGYWFDGTKDELGHYVATGYTNDIPWIEPYPISNKSVINITDNFGWGTGYMYAWDADGNELTGTWPGTVVETTANAYGENEFVCNIPDNAIGIIISDGNGNQSEDITDFSNYDGYWFDGTKNVLGHYIATGYVDNPVDPTTEPTDDVDPDPVEFNWFYNTLNFEDVYVYAWDDDGNALVGDWPGRQLTTKEYSPKYECDRYWFAEFYGAAGFIINDGGIIQTVDVTDYESFKLDGEKDDEGHYLITTCSGYYDEPPQPDDPPQYSEKFEKEFLDWSVENFGEKCLQDGYDYKVLYTHTDEGNPDWALVKASFNLPEPDPVTWLRIGGIDGRTVISGSLKEPFMFGYGIYDVKENKFYGLEEFAEKVDPVFYDRDGQPLDYSKYDGLIQALADAKVGYKTGDTNGDGRVDILDATAIQKNAVEKIRLNEIQYYQSDVNSDGTVDVLDAVEIQKYAVL